MENFNEEDNQRDFKKIFLIGGGILVLAIAGTAYLLYKNKSDSVLNKDKSNTPYTSSPTGSNLGSSSSTPVYSSDLATWNNYFWPEKMNVKYPSNWELIEMEVKTARQLEVEKSTGKSTKGEVVGLKMIPPTGNPADAIFIGGTTETCTSVKKFTENKCLKNKIQVPFYTESTNPDVISAFNEIYKSTMLSEALK